MSTGGSLQTSSAASSSAPPLLGVGDEGCEPLANQIIFAASEMQQPQGFLLADGSATLFTRPAPAKTTANEDVVALVSLGLQQGVLIVADGLGGHANGEDAAKLAVTEVIHSLHADNSDSSSDTARAAILNGFEAANRAVLSLGNGSASTLAVAEIFAGIVRTYHVGDSSILLTGGRGRVKLQTIAHSPVGYAVEAGLIDECEAMHHEDRHVISNVIGDSDMRIEIGPSVELAPRDTLLLASDGLFDNLMQQEIIELIRRGPLELGVERLVGKAFGRMTHPNDKTPSKPDDLSVIAFRLR